MTTPRVRAQTLPMTSILTKILAEAETEGDGAHVEIKVGRSNDINLRITEWSKQCPSKRPQLLGTYPVKMEDSQAKGGMASVVDVMLKHMNLSHRLERLVHSELADLVKYEQYLQVGFVTGDLDPPESSSSPNAKREAYIDCACRSLNPMSRNLSSIC
jgi:hypothetical protein